MKGRDAMRGHWFAVLALTLLLPTLPAPAHADWLAGAWPADASGRHGSPAITLNQSGAVALVLPDSVLTEAQAAGLSTEGAVSAFLGRYAPSMCSDLVDLTVPHAKLKVDLLIQRPVALSDMDDATQNDAAAALNHALASSAKRLVPHIEGAFVVDRQRLNLSIDYAPDHRVRCIEPPDVIY
jgi:hypothetical protein